MQHEVLRETRVNFHKNVSAFEENLRKYALGRTQCHEWFARFKGSRQ